MNKPIIPKEDGKLKSICNGAFYGVKRILPSSIRESEKYDKGLAAILGAGSGYLIAWGGEQAINLVNTVGVNLDLEKITAYSLFFTLGTLIMPRIIAPKYVKKFIKENPLYSIGAATVMTGASLKALEVLGSFGKAYDYLEMLSKYVQ